MRRGQHLVRWVGPLLAAAVLAASGAAAAMGASGMGRHDISTATLAAPTGLSTTVAACSPNTSVSVDVTWTATPSEWATGYEVMRRTEGSFEVIASVTGHGTTAYRDNTVTFATTYLYTVRATYATWSSVVAPETQVTTPPATC